MIVGMLNEIFKMFTPYTIILILLSPITYKYIDLLLLCCVNACVYFIIAYINPGYIKVGDLVIENVYIKIPIDIAAHWLPLVLMYVYYGSFYKNEIQSKAVALLLYGCYMLLVDYKKVYDMQMIWMFMIGGTAGLVLEAALLLY